jgi:hypothetical protein
LHPAALAGNDMQLRTLLVLRRRMAGGAMNTGTIKNKPHSTMGLVKVLMAIDG